MPDHHGGPAEPVHPRLRPDHRIPGRHGLRHPARRRYGLFRRADHAVLRLSAGKGDRLGADPRRDDRPHGPGAQGIPHSGRRHQPALPRGADRAAEIPERRYHHPLHRRDAGVVRLQAAARPGDAPARLPGRRHRQRQPGGGGPAGGGALHGAGAAQPTGRHAGQRQPATPPGTWPGRLRPLDARPGTPADHRHHLARCPPVAAGDPLPQLRSAAPRTADRPATARAAVARVLGRRHLRCGHAVPGRRSLGAPRRLQPAGAEHPAADAAARRQRRRLQELPGQRGAAFRCPGGRRGGRPLPNLRFAELDREHAGLHGRGAGGRQALRGGDLLQRRPERPGLHQVRSRLLRRPRQGARGSGRPHSRHQGHGRPLQAGGGGPVGHRAQAGDRHSDPFPHPRHQRHFRGQRAGRR